MWLQTEDPMADNLEESIRKNAAGPRRASGDAGSIEQHSLTDQIALAKHLSAQKAAAGPGFGVRLIKLSPPEAV